ncbi:S9 family peptidase [Hyphococcus sp.]|uniref:S9 family peptidase n=1 Tax=Hyphococcus sp. TaxID=2038636 RepID=UPI002081D0DB|nr:MAG: peptidase S9 [Marinicaulis sp.]
MKAFLICAGLVSLAVLSACNQSPSSEKNSGNEEKMMTERDPFADAKNLAAPVVEKRPLETTQHGITRVDNYAWLRDAEWQDVLRDPETLDDDIRAVLDAENAYYAAVTDDLEPLRKKLFVEMRGRIKEDDSSVPAKDGDWLYSSRFRDGGEYPVFVRQLVSGGDEQVIYDGDAERGDSKFFSIGDVSQSPDHELAAIAVDRLGSEYYSIRIRNMETGEDYPDVIESADGSGATWAADSGSFFYVERDDNQRPKRVKLHKLGTDPASDKLIYEEADDAFFLDVSKSQSGDYIFIYSGNHVSSEARFIPANAPDAAPVLIAPRENNVEYYPDHHGDQFFIRTNAGGAVDFKIVTAPIAAPGRENWKDWVAHKPGSQIVDFTPYKDFIVRVERENALPRIIVSDYAGASHSVSFDEAAYSLSMSSGYEYDTNNLRFTYESPSTPDQTYDYDMATRARILRKTLEVPSGHDASLYVVERIEADGEGGAKIPVTILRLKTTPRDGSAPALLYGYGSYGSSTAASFSTNILPLVDRGAVYAIAHVRGGSDKGRQWYLDGKLDKKMNTFTDFAAAADALIAGGYTAPKKIVLYGGSAGGLLVAATVNLRPELFGGVIGAVPFIDVINTISDAELPLTPPEWEEWGNPITSAEEYGWIAEYSPYENIRNTDYPPIMATGGLTDYRVTYWEPAKWIARLRDEATGGPFVLRMNMGAGHGGSAARFERLDERAHLYAFALKAWGIEDAKPVTHKK